MTQLPLLREDLSLLQGTPERGGVATWLIHDPLQHRYIQIDATTFAILALWRAGVTTEALCVAVGREIGAPVPKSEIERLIGFLDQHHLLQTSTKDWRALARAQGAHRQCLFGWLAHNFLFVKVPLVRCDTFLARTAPAVAMLASRGALLALLLCGMAGLYLATRQWDQLVLAMLSLATLEGAFGLAIALFVVKAFHELGHAYVAAHFGCRVPTIGLALVMLAPMLYTDVTDAWRLVDRRKRVLIDAAGVAVELAIACIATLLWAILPDGTARTIALLLATTSWVMSVAVNLNPFMRFDGYYILADAVGIANLQPRAFSVALWWTRERLFALGEPCPEQLDARTIRWLVVYAWITWIVRLVTYVGIALLVYAYFFKALGIAMFIFEVWWFVLQPLRGELAQWWSRRDRIMSSRRTVVTSGVLVLAMAAFAMPWSTTVYVPAVLQARQLVHVYPPRTARVVTLHVVPGQRVEAGATLVVLDVPDLDFEERAYRSRLQAVNLRLARFAADAQDREDRIVLESEQAAISMRLETIARQRSELRIKAPFAGVVAELEPHLHAGRWVTTKDQIALIIAKEQALVRGYVDEADIGRVEPGASGRFVPDDPQARSIDVVLSRIAVGGAATLDMRELATPSGGRISAQPNAKQLLVPQSAQFPVEFDAFAPAHAPDRNHRGLVHVSGAAQSPMARTWRRVLRVLIQESGA